MIEETIALVGRRSNFFVHWKDKFVHIEIRMNLLLAHFGTMLILYVMQKRANCEKLNVTFWGIMLSEYCSNIFYCSMFNGKITPLFALR
jgi:hypothetical protein